MISDNLNRESVTFVPWSGDERRYIVSALFPLKADYVKVVEMDAERQVAYVEVTQHYVFKREFGTEDINSKLASQLTGYLIIPTVKERSIEDDPERDLEWIISEAVREVRDKEVRIVNIARLRGVGAKVLVAWQARQKEPRRAASTICGYKLSEIRDKVNGEFVHFHEWYEDEKKLVVECLYPLRKEDVKDIKVLAERHLIEITVNSAGLSPAVWKSNRQLTLVRRLTGWGVEVVQG
jgi:transcription antitermination factor NusA-like protein